MDISSFVELDYPWALLRRTSKEKEKKKKLTCFVARHIVELGLFWPTRCLINYYYYFL
jgi:hypothetical protein